MGGEIRSHHDLKVWQLGMEITEKIYAITSTFPADERFGLIAQLRRAASSIPANIAEGNGRASTREFLRHISIAIGSLCEVETFIQLASRLKFGDAKLFQEILEELAEEGRMLRGLQRSLAAKIKPEFSPPTTSH
ncbi:MAG TPA: four helix bundle protein [Lacipirellulaceae bacterium]|nr:four helix bundle protein [Lacipirellulaceae bacterium]